MNLSKKVPQMERLVSELKQRPSLIFIKDLGISANEVNKLRRDLKSDNVKFIVVKNTLAKKALEKNDLKFDLSFAGCFKQKILILASDSFLNTLKKIELFDKQKYEITCLSDQNGTIVDKDLIEIAKKTSYGSLVSMVRAPYLCFMRVLKAIIEQKEKL